jgi:hypothetical protein
MKRAQALVTALHEITFSTNHSERVLLRPQHKLTPEGPIASLATKMTPLEFPFRAFEEKDGPPPLRPQLAAPRVTPEASGRVLTFTYSASANSPINVASRFSPGSGVKWSTLRCNNRMYSRRGSLIQCITFESTRLPRQQPRRPQKEIQKNICQKKLLTRRTLC